MTTSNPKMPGWAGKLVRFGLPVLVLTLASAGAWQIMASSPKANKRAPNVQARLVEVQPVIQKDIHVSISGLGTVVPSQQLALYPEISGQIEALRASLLPGSQVRKGELLISVEATDYQISLQQQQANVALAEADLQKEMGQQAIARQEFELMDPELTPTQKALVLRQPELAAAKARLAQAKAQQAQAQLDLDRTRITAPFDAQVIERTVETGSQITTSTSLMSMVAIDEFWLELEIPSEDLQWLSFGDQSGRVTLTSPAWSDQQREGRLLSFSPELDPGSRMAKLTVAIDDPMALKPENHGKPKVLLNDLLRADIEGRGIAMAAVVPDAQLHNGNQIWLYRNDNTLEIRTVSPVYRDADKAIITSGLNSNDTLVTSAITAAVDGMALRTASPMSGEQKKTDIAKRSHQQ